MARQAHLAVVALVLASLVIAHAAPCPNFDCKRGSFVKGRFPSKNPPYSYLALYVDDPDIPDDPQLLHAPLHCYDYCKGLGAKYWLYEDTCHVNGDCFCFNEDVCTNGLYDATDYTAVTTTTYDDGSQNYQPGIFYSVGKICDSNITGDPHFTGADNSRYDFSGIPNKSFTLLSDAHLHINAFFGGRWGSWMGNPHKALTWMRKISVLWGHHTVVFEAREGADWKYNNGYLKSISFDGESLRLTSVGEKISVANGAVSVSWEAARALVGDDLVDVYMLEIANVAKIRLTLKPEIALLRTTDDGLVHFTVELVESRLSSNVHGVLGQTYRPDFAGRLLKQKLVYSDLLKAMVVPGDNAEGFLDGSVEDYMVSDLVKADSKFSRFARSQAVDEETARAIEAATSVSSSYSGASIPRKALIASSR